MCSRVNLGTSRQIAALAGGMCAVYHILMKRRNRQKWVKSWIAMRQQLSHMPLIKQLKMNEPQDFKNYLRMDESDFEFLLGKIEKRLKKQDTVMRQSIPPTERLIATLRFLATGRSFEDLKYTTGIASQTLGYIIPETCQIIFEELKEEYLRLPQTSAEWQHEARHFKEKWQIINCGGSIDGKHIRIVQPPGSGALYYNYKKFYSVILMAVVNAKYEFIYVDVGKQGRLSDGGVLDSTTFSDRLRNGSLNLPTNDMTEESLNFVFVGDEAFPLHKHILKPYAQRTLTYERRIFNYRMSRARNVAENAFGIAAARFRVLHTSINMKPENINFVVLAVCVLHNFMIRRSNSYFNSLADRVDLDTGEILPGLWRNEQDGPASLVGLDLTLAKPSIDAKTNRENYMRFFNDKGKISWQDEMISKCKA